MSSSLYPHTTTTYLCISPSPTYQKLVVFTLSPYNHNISLYISIPNIPKACRLHSIPIQPQHISVYLHPQHTKSLSSSLYPHTTTTYLCISPSPTYQKLVVFTLSPYNHNISLYISIPNIPKACRLHSIPIQPQHISVYLHPQHTKSLSSSLYPHTTHNISLYISIPNILKACRLHSIPIQPQHISVYLHPQHTKSLSSSLYPHTTTTYLCISPSPTYQKLVVFTLSPYNHNISLYISIPNIPKACHLHSIPIQPQHISSSLHPHTTTTYLCISPSPTYQKLVVFTLSPYNHNISLYISIPNIPKACRLHSIPIQPQHISVYLHPQHTKSLSSSLYPHTTTTYLCISPSPTYQKLVVFTLSPYNHNISLYISIPNIPKACRLHSIPIQPQHISVYLHPQHTKSLSSSLHPHTTTTYLCISPSPTYQKLVVFTLSPYNHNISLYISIPNIPKACRLHSIPIQPQHIYVSLQYISFLHNAVCISLLFVIASFHNHISSTSHNHQLNTHLITVYYCSID